MSKEERRNELNDSHGSRLCGHDGKPCNDARCNDTNCFRHCNTRESDAALLREIENK